MSKAEERRYISLDREILKSTAFIDRLMREGYQVLMLSTRLTKLSKLMEGPQSEVGTEEAGTDNKQRIVYGLDGEIVEPDKLSSNVVFYRGSWVDLGESEYMKHYFKISVMFYITHPKFLHHNGHGETVTWNPDIPVALPGTWKRVLYKEKPYVLENEKNPEDPRTHYVNGISGAKLQILRKKTWHMDHFIPERQTYPGHWETLPYPGHWDGLDGHLGCWNVCTDIAEDGVQICFFQRVPQSRGSKPFLLQCFDKERSGANRPPVFLDCRVADPYNGRRHVALEVLHLNQRPDKIDTAAKAAWTNPQPYSDVPFRDIPMLGNAEKDCHSLLIAWFDECNDYAFSYLKVPLTIKLDE